MPYWLIGNRFSQSVSQSVGDISIGLHGGELCYTILLVQYNSIPFFSSHCTLAKNQIRWTRQLTPTTTNPNRHIKTFVTRITVKKAAGSSQIPQQTPFSLYLGCCPGIGYRLIIPISNLRYVGYSTVPVSLESPTQGCVEEEEEYNACWEPITTKHLESQSDARGKSCSPGPLAIHLGNDAFRTLPPPTDKNKV